MGVIGRNVLIDILKGLSIIAVILYHLGVSKYGYLGVDVFFVISGYLVTFGLVKSLSLSKFSYWKYINKRLARLWPGLIVISFVALVLGYIYMMPMHFKLDCESVIGTCLYFNNVIQEITGGNYWASANEFKPLMHTWYIGILMQFYVIFPLIFILMRRYTKEWLLNSVYVITILSLGSILVYVSPIFKEVQNFYLLPARFFELGVGGILAIAIAESADVVKRIRPLCFSTIIIVALILMFYTDIDVMKLRLIIVVAISLMLIYSSNYFSLNSNARKVLFPITFMGVASYSLYLSHQVFIAFYRYIVNNVFTLSSYLIILCITIIIGIIFYFIFERPLSIYLSKRSKNMYIVNGVSAFIVLILSLVSLYFYKNNGLVRDIPELGIYIGKNSETPEDYNTVNLLLDRDFPDNGKKNIFVLGDSYARDFINILKESGVDSVMNISYSKLYDTNTKERIHKADFVFVATISPFLSSYNYDEIYPDLFNRKFYRVGVKSFGECFFGNIYCKRNSESYYEIVVPEKTFSKEINDYESRLFGENFIDMMTPLKDYEGNIKLFDENKQLITQDGLHLTRAGAKMYAKRINVWQYLK